VAVKVTGELVRARAHEGADIALEVLLIEGGVVHPTTAISRQFVVAKAPEDNSAILSLAMVDIAKSNQEWV
jgi:hypothetical protein